VSALTLRYRNRVAALTRHGRTPTDPDLVAARQDLAAAKIADAIHLATLSAPPLTAEQRNRLAALLMSGGDDVR